MGLMIYRLHPGVLLLGSVQHEMGRGVEATGWTHTGPAGRHAKLVFRLKGPLRPFGISAVLPRCTGSDLVLLGLLSLNRPGETQEDEQSCSQFCHDHLLFNLLTSSVRSTLEVGASESSFQ
jgi:hypothetical protein